MLSKSGRDIAAAEAEFDAATLRTYRAKKALNKQRSAAKNVAEREAIDAQIKAENDVWYAEFLKFCRIQET